MLNVDGDYELNETAVDYLARDSGSDDTDHIPELNTPITMQEVMLALAKAKHGKAQGVDAIPVEVLHNAAALKCMHTLYTKCFDEWITPSVWAMGVINPIPKSPSNDPREPLSYRGITLASAVYKLYCHVLNARLSTWTEDNDIVADEQNCFRRGRSTIDHLSTLTSVIETGKLKRQSTFVAFIESKKAYDKIQRPVLWYKLRQLGIGGRFYQALRSIYNKTRYRVRVNGFNTDWFDVECGLKQGCLLSPALFNLYINDLVAEIKSLHMGVRLDNDLLCILLYADDVALLAENEEDLQRMLDVLQSHAWCSRWQLHINCEKSRVVHFRDSTRQVSGQVCLP